MKKQKNNLISSFFPAILFAQKEFSAKIYDGINFTPIHEAIIYNLTSNYVFQIKMEILPFPLN